MIGKNCNGLTFLGLLSLGLNRVRICITPHTYFVAWCLPHRTLVRLDQMNSSQDKRVTVLQCAACGNKRTDWSQPCLFVFVCLFLIIGMYVQRVCSVCFCTVVRRTIPSQRSAPTSWHNLVGGAGACSTSKAAGRTTSSASVSRTPAAPPACTWMTSWLPSSRTWAPRALEDSSCPSGRPRAGLNHQPEACSQLEQQVEPERGGRLVPPLMWRDSRRGGKCEKVKSLPLLTVVQEGRRTGNGWVRIPPPLWRGLITF